MPASALRILYVMDPLARILVDKDTTFAFMIEGEQRGHEQYHCGIEDLFAVQARPVARVRRMHAPRADPPCTLHEERTVPLVGFDVVYLPVVREEGDKRLIVLAGEPLGAVRRIPREDEHRGNIHVGGRVERAPVDARDHEICRRMAERLNADGLYFVGLDVIGGLVTEVNVTSPTGVQEIDRLDGVCLEARVLDFVEARAATLDRRAAAH